VLASSRSADRGNLNSIGYGERLQLLSCGIRQILGKFISNFVELFVAEVPLSSIHLSELP